MWEGTHAAVARALVEAYMPSGGGIDDGTKIDLDASTHTRLVFTTAYHHMSANGFYDGWTEHTVRVVPLFTGFAISISGRNRNDVKFYLEQTFEDALMRIIALEDYHALCERVNKPAALNV
jgi:hypothetical protein